MVDDGGNVACAVICNCCFRWIWKYNFINFSCQFVDLSFVGGGRPKMEHKTVLINAHTHRGFIFCFRFFFGRVFIEATNKNWFFLRSCSIRRFSENQNQHTIRKMKREITTKRTPNWFYGSICRMIFKFRLMLFAFDTFIFRFSAFSSLALALSLFCVIWWHLPFTFDNST